MFHGCQFRLHAQASVATPGIQRKRTRSIRKHKKEPAGYREVEHKLLHLGMASGVTSKPANGVARNIVPFIPFSPAQASPFWCASYVAWSRGQSRADSDRNRLIRI